MKAMKALSVNRVLGSVRRRASPSIREQDERDTNEGLRSGTPEQVASRNVLLFCESGGPNNQGEEVLYLPTIVDIAESSPAAAKECAQVIRKCISRDNNSKPHMQYNGVMLMRILSDHPGKTFTSNMDAKFVSSVKELLRMGHDPSVKQILWETLENFTRELVKDDNLVAIVDMWKKEQLKLANLQRPQEITRTRPARDPRALRQHTASEFSQREATLQHLPTPYELSTRIEEARMSAKLLTQVIQSTPPAEIIHNDLIREFADRCRYASQTLRGYMNADNPAPDNETMLTLIETDEQLALAMSKHHRAILNNRKALGLHTEPGKRHEDRADPNISIRSSAYQTSVRADASAISDPVPTHAQDGKSMHTTPHTFTQASSFSTSMSRQTDAAESLNYISVEPTAYPRKEGTPSGYQFIHHDHDSLGTSSDRLASGAVMSFDPRSEQENSIGAPPSLEIKSEASSGSRNERGGSGVILEQPPPNTSKAPVFRY